MPAIAQPTPPRVSLVEVGPRDGLQNERVQLTVDQRVSLVEGLVAAGLKQIEVGSFVHPRWIPQMAGTDEVIRRLPRREGLTYWALVPNDRGLDGALEAGCDAVAVFLSSSQTHNKRNLNRTTEESLAGIREVVARAHQHGLRVRGYISTVFGCPYEGVVDFARVLEIGDALLDLQIEQISLGDTTGMGTPLQVQTGMQRALERFSTDRVALHLHDTRGVGLANALVALEVGCRTFDTSVGGMGGCPYAPGAAGNLGTEDLVHMLHAMGVDTGLNLEALVEVSRRLDLDLGATLNSAYYRYARSGTSPRVCA